MGAPPTLDEEIAWALLREVAMWAGESKRFHLEERPGVWLEVDADGDWLTFPRPTDAARDLLEIFIPLALQPDLVIGQLGQSIDGRIATESGHSHYVTGPADIRRLHRLRALVDAVVVGAGTVAMDDPRLTVREVQGENPVRVVLDPDDRLGADHNVFSDGEARTIVVRRETTEASPDEPGTTAPGAVSWLAGQASGASGGEVVYLPGGPDGFEPAALLQALRARGLRRVLVEGGGVTVSRFLQAGLLDRLHLTVAPLLIGSGRPALTLPPIDTLAGAIRPKCRHFRLGEDLLFDLDLKRG